MVTIDDLPEEILRYIFCKLSLPQRRMVRLVSKHWLQQCNCARITKNELVRVRLPQTLNQLKIPRDFLNLEVFETPVFVYPNQVFFAMNEDQLQEYHQFWTQHGESVRTLTMRNISGIYPKLSTILNSCSNITDITMFFLAFNNDSAYDSILENSSAKLDCLLNLCISGLFAFKMRGEILILFARASKLKSLKLENISAREEALETFIEEFIAKQSSTLQHLTIFNCEFASGKSLKNILLQMGPQLRGLYLKSQFLDFEGLARLACKIDLSNIENLELSQCGRLGRDSVSNLLLSFTNVQFLSLRGTQLTDDGLSILVGLEHLKGLDIGSNRFTEGGILQCFRQKVHIHLIALGMSFSDAVTDSVLASILPRLPSLEYLDLSHCSNITTVGAIINSCKQLTHLLLENCQQIRYLN